MMISPEGYLEDIKNKPINEIEKEIIELKNTIKELKYEIENPNGQLCLTHPSYEVQLSCMRQYLEKAIALYVQNGGHYEFSDKEKETIEFQNNIPYISKITVDKSGYSPRDFGSLIVEFQDDKVIVEKNGENIALNEDEEEFDKKEIFRKLKDMYIGNWNSEYTPEQFDMCISDGVSWKFTISFSNRANAKEVFCNNVQPCNFSDFLSLFNAYDLSYDDYFDDEEND